MPSIARFQSSLHSFKPIALAGILILLMGGANSCSAAPPEPPDSKVSQEQEPNSPPKKPTGALAASVGEDAAELYRLHDLFAEALGQIESNYVERVDRRKLFDAALRAMLQELDPHCKYLDQSEAAGYRQEVMGDSADPNSSDSSEPAQSVTGFARGADGSWRYQVRDGVSYVRIAAFDSDTAQELADSLQRIEKEGGQSRGIVLDLRNNAGGLLESAVEVADSLLESGEIVATQGRNVARHVWNASPGEVTDAPLAVLVNRYSASAAEVVAACLQDHQRGVIVGERTYGKGSVQNLIELAGGEAAIKLTTATYRRPSGVDLQRPARSQRDGVWGVTPDTGLAVPLTEEQTGRLAAQRKAFEAEHAQEPADTPSEIIEDAALDLAVKHLLTRSEKLETP